MFLFTYTAVPLTVFFLGLAAFLFVKKRRDPLATFFALHLLTAAVWIGSNAMADIVDTEGALLFWSGTALIGASFFASFFLCFTDTFVSGKIPTRSRVFIYLTPSIVFSTLAFSEYSVVETILLSDIPNQIIPGSIYNIFPFYHFAAFIYGAVRVSASYKVASTQRRLQIIYMEIGFILLILGGAVFDSLLPLLGELRFFNLGPQFAFFTAILSFYAIFKHQLLDIRLAVQRSVIYSSLLVFITGFYVFSINTFNFLWGSLTGLTTIASALLTSMVGIIGAPYIKNWFERVTDKIFFKDKYDYSAAMHDLSEILNTSVEHEEIIARSTSALKRILKTEEVEICLHRVNNHDAQYIEITDGGARMNAPIVSNVRTIGLMTLGEKMSGDAYTQTDVRLIKTFAYQAAVALEKAALYESAKRHAVDLEEKVRERTREIMALQENERQMMVEISHALQTPLTILTSELENLKRDFPGTNGIDEFQRSVDMVSKYVYDLLNLARLEQDSDPQKITRVDLSALLNEIVEYVDVLAQEQGIHVSKAIADGVYVEAEKEHLAEAVINLLSNAVKYMGEGKKKEIMVSLASDDTSVVMTIRDTGVGIAENDRAHLFERFFRANDGDVTRTKGTGLGLSIVKRIIERHRGTITVESVPKNGTTFTIRIPHSGVRGKGEGVISRADRVLDVC